MTFTRIVKANHLFLNKEEKEEYKRLVIERSRINGQLNYLVSKLGPDEYEISVSVSAARTKQALVAVKMDQLESLAHNRFMLTVSSLIGLAGISATAVTMFLLKSL